MRAPVGLRIRNYRKSKGLSQSALARLVEISASYLNLIEANKRDVGGLLLQKIAARLQVDLHDLTGESEQRLINELQEAFADPLLAPLKLTLDDAHRLVALFPESARALHTCFRGYLEAVASLERASNRLQSDPIFSQLLHKMLSQITAVRSVAEILKNVPDLPEAERQEFYDSVHKESLALSDTARTLIGQFEEEVDQRRTITPARELNDMIIGENNYFPGLEDAADTLRSKVSLPQTATEEQLTAILKNRHNISVETSISAGTPQTGAGHPEPGHSGPEQLEKRQKGTGIPGYDAPRSVMTFKPHIASATKRFQLARLLASLDAAPVLERLSSDQRLTSPEARQLAQGAMASYLAGALIFPYDRFLADAEHSNYDLEVLARTYRASFEQIAHRLVTLRKPGAQGIPFGFLRADPAGYLTKQFPLPGLLMPNAGHACPLWAVYASFRTPGTLVRQIASFADGSRYLFIAKMGAKRVTAFNELPVLSSVMLACDLIHADKTVYGGDIRLDAAALDIAVGPSCRLCTRPDCSHRQEAATTMQTLSN